MILLILLQAMTQKHLHCSLSALKRAGPSQARIPRLVRVMCGGHCHSITPNNCNFDGGAPLLRDQEWYIATFLTADSTSCLAAERKPGMLVTQGWSHPSCVESTSAREPRDTISTRVRRDCCVVGWQIHRTLLLVLSNTRRAHS